MIKGLAKTRLSVPSKTLFFQIDIMEKFRTLTYNYQSLVMVGRILMQTSHKFDIPLIMVEQNKKAFGETAKEILEVKHPKVIYFEKHIMSAYQHKELKDIITKLDPRNIVIYGLEAHACVLHTTLDLLDAGYNVHAVVEGISSISKLDRAAALHRISKAGGILTTTETILLDLVRDSKSQEFKTLLELVKGKLKVDNPFLTI